MDKREQKKVKNPEGLRNLPHGLGIEWESRRIFRLGGYKFSLPISFEQFARSVPAEDNYSDNVFSLLKTPDIIRRYVTLCIEAKPKTVVQLGVFRGGSVGLVQLLARPERLLALELDPDRQAFLDRFIEHEGLEDSVRVEYGVDQADSVRVDRLAQEFLGEGRSIDLVFDDASHMLSATRSSFETLFPLIRPGGSYIVEDFATAQILISQGFKQMSSDSGGDSQILGQLVDHCLQADSQPLHLLAVEAMLASIVAPSIVRKVVIDREWLKIVRGAADVDPTQRFDLRALADDHFGLLNTAPDEELQNFLSSR